MKRKVTDLKPNEAILISNDAERDAVLNLFHEAGIKWVSGTDVTNWHPSFNYPFGLQLNTKKLYNEPLWYLDKLSCITYPATDFIGSEGESVEFPVFDFGVEQLKAELDYWKTRCELAEKFIEESPCDPDIYEDQLKAWNEYQEFIKPRNTPTNEQR
jgi:hypothetical protein